MQQTGEQYSAEKRVLPESSYRTVMSILETQRDPVHNHSNHIHTEAFDCLLRTETKELRPLQMIISVGIDFEVTTVKAESVDEGDKEIEYRMLFSKGSQRDLTIKTEDFDTAVEVHNAFIEQINKNSEDELRVANAIDWLCTHSQYSELVS
jgi:hypothetical protein